MQSLNYTKTDLNFSRDSLSKSFLEWPDADPAWENERSCSHALSPIIEIRDNLHYCPTLLLSRSRPQLGATISHSSSPCTPEWRPHQERKGDSSYHHLPVPAFFGFGMGQECRNWEREWNVRGCPPDVREVLHCRFQRATTPSTVTTPLKVCCILIYTGCRKIVPGDGIIYCP